MTILEKQEIQGYLMDVNDPTRGMDNAWNEGFLTGLHYAGKIDDLGYDELMLWIKNFGE